jgi:hypothetical protein
VTRCSIVVRHSLFVCFSWMQRNMSDAEILERNSLVSAQGLPAFQSSLAPECHISTFSTQYDKFSLPDISNPIVRLSQALLRTILLQATASGGAYSDCTDGNTAHSQLCNSINESVLNETWTFSNFTAVIELICSDHSSSELYNEC